MNEVKWNDKIDKDMKDEMSQKITLFGATFFATKWYLCMARTHWQIEVQALDT